MDGSSRQKWIVLIFSVGLTALLVGALAGAGIVFRSMSKRLEDVDFLQERLKQLKPPSGPSEAKPALVRVARAEQKSVQPIRTLVGRLVEVRRVVASSEVSGKIVGFPLEEGDFVEAGKTVLARIDDIWVRLALQQYQAQWIATSAQLEYERTELRRLEELWKAAAITESELHQKQSQVAQLEAKLQELQAAMDQESERQKRSVVYAPFDGVITAKHAELGQYVSPGAPLMEMISRGQIDARVMVPESAVNLIQLGQAISIFVDPLGEEVEGSVVSITPFGPTASRTFPVHIRIADPKDRLKVGMSITARVPTGPQKLALVVPPDAVLEKPDEAVVWVVAAEKTLEEDLSAKTAPGPQPFSSLPLSGSQQSAARGVAQPVPVTIELRLPGEYAVVPQRSPTAALLKPGVQVVIEGAERLLPGQKVQIVP